MLLFIKLTNMPLNLNWLAGIEVHTTIAAQFLAFRGSEWAWMLGGKANSVTFVEQE